MATTKKTTKKTVKKSVKKTEDVLTKKVINPNDKIVYVTEVGLKKLKDELTELETVKRKEIAARLQEAISYGDLSENSEYQEAKEAQAFLEGRVIELTKELKNVEIISDKHAGKINLWSKIELKNLDTKEKETYIIVGSTEINPFEGKISNESELWNAALGKKKWDNFKYTAPKGNFSYEVLKVS